MVKQEWRVDMHFWILVAILSALISWSIWVRICHFRATESVKVKQTAFSMAVQELVATAGGVYLSIIALISFLKLNLPEKVSVLGVAFDPVALLAIGVAITQPWWSRLFPNDAE